MKPCLFDLDLVVFDFDGVLTDNRVYVFEDGREAVCCNRADGLGFDVLRKVGLEAIIVSTEKNAVVGERAKKLRIGAIQGVADKARTLDTLIKERHLDATRVAFIGNDINDLEAMKIVGWPIAPSDAHPKVLAISRMVTEAPGGAGVAREFAELFEHDI